MDAVASKAMQLRGVDPSSPIAIDDQLSLRAPMH